MIAAVDHWRERRWGNVAPEHAVRFAADVIIDGSFRLTHWFQFQWPQCYTGVIAIRWHLGHGEFTHSDFWDRSRVVWGHQNRLVLWSVPGMPCMHF